MRSRRAHAFRSGMLPAILAASLMAACAAAPIKWYAGPARDKSQIATLAADGPIVLRVLDGERVPEGSSGAELELLPGGHKTQFGYRHEICYYADINTLPGIFVGRIPTGRECKVFYYGDAVLEFDAVAGHSYKIYAGSTMTTWRPYIQDRTSGAVVVASATDWPL